VTAMAMGLSHSQILVLLKIPLGVRGRDTRREIRGF
jgi:hypothetical protein